MAKCLYWVTLLLFVIPAFAQDTEEEREIRRYTVEMIIFRYAQEVSVGTEVFVPDDPPERSPTDLELALDSRESIPSDRLPDGNRAADEARTDDAEADTKIDMNEENMVFTLLREEDFTLSDTFARMQRLEVYEPLMHFGWSQSTLPEEETRARPLRSFAVPAAGLDGELTLYLSRFLHLALNLQLDAERTPADTIRRQRRVNILGEDIVELAQEQKNRYRIVENRIVRNGELRYFDHPKFGVLAKVTRVEESEEETDTPGTDEIDDSENDELLGDIP